MSAAASQITGVSIVCSPVCSGAPQSRHQSSASLVFVRGIHRSPVNSPHKGPVTRKMVPFDDVIMKTAYVHWDSPISWISVPFQYEVNNEFRSNHNQVVKVACSIVMPQLTLKHLLKWHFIVFHSSVLHGWALISNLKDIASKLNAWHQFMWLKLVLILRYAGAQHKYIFIYSFLSL